MEMWQRLARMIFVRRGETRREYCRIYKGFNEALAEIRPQGLSYFCCILVLVMMNAVALINLLETLAAAEAVHFAAHAAEHRRHTALRELFCQLLHGLELL